MISIHLYSCPHPHLREVSITELIARVGAWWILPFVNIGSTGACLMISTALKELGRFWSNDQKYIPLTSCKLMNNELFVRVYNACGPIVGTSNSLDKFGCWIGSGIVSSR